MNSPAPQCSKCASSPPKGAFECSSCGGKIVRACPSCGFKNSAAKNFCDVCGDSMDGTPQESRAKKTPPPVFKDDGEPPPEPDRKIPLTVIRRAPAEPAKPPKELDRPPSPPPPLPFSKPPQAGPKKQPLPKPLALTRRTLLQVKKRPIASTVAVLVLFLASAGLYGLLLRGRDAPSEKLLKAAGDYLFALKSKDLPTAYAMLSSDSKASLTLEKFSSLQEDAVWGFDELQIESVTEKWGYAAYKLLVSGRPVENDWLHFVLEDGEWKRAYWWHLFGDIEAALERRDFAAALNAANEAARINPRDPLVNSYLCEAAYGLERWDTAVSVCKRTFQASQKFRSRLEPKDIFHLRTLLADIARLRSPKPAEAIEEYSIMLSFPLLDAAGRCDILLARADTALGATEHAKALSDYKEASTECPSEDDRAYAHWNSRVLSGQAGDEAIARLKRHRMPGAKESLAEWRRSLGESVARDLKTSVSELSSGETWRAEHESGALYAVILSDRKTEILSGRVDLLSKTIQVKINVQ